jgi:hypothetical protein
LRTVKKLLGYAAPLKGFPPLIKRKALMFSGSVDADQIIARRIVRHGSIRRMSALGQKRTWPPNSYSIADVLNPENGHVRCKGRCPLWVKSRHVHCNRPCLLCARKRTFTGQHNPKLFGQNLKMLRFSDDQLGTRSINRTDNLKFNAPARKHKLT